MTVASSSVLAFTFLAQVRRSHYFHLAAGLNAADAGTPAVFLESPVDVGGHRVGRVHPGVFLALVSVRFFFERKLIDRSVFAP